MSELLPPNATPLERRIATTNGRISSLPVDIGTLMDPNEIALPFLPCLAWHLSVDSWRDSWPEVIKRARVKTAIRVARIRGTAEAVRQVCASFGANVVMREWFDMTPRGKPGTFEIVMTAGFVNGLPATAESVADVIAEVNRAKRGTAHYTFTQGFSSQARQRVGAAARVAVYCRLNLSDR
ncbi:phage tail protein I [Trinickia symbiotica]|uniref:Phage tail protein I n=1 Tax=Trinickia symbiotica TaxID=863227 RepID=A0A2T3XSX2_9BURK|nr:phage tail protein I [Trinickia symbiotica]PTB19552.1 phage tail protein I [Trinickia symbiotica]